ncbi:MAG: hypothetical protein A2749_02570 [Parcubacteria group bacterium RIFCSPHIGHO2_01_FULL_45_26]|nr:MAG: hypothetical protein A2749_02570 [Parcubacteria group bacterium RIFCSPHIGHO2_01_FULL_45_26]
MLGNVLKGIGASAVLGLLVIGAIAIVDDVVVPVIGLTLKGAAGSSADALRAQSASRPAELKEREIIWAKVVRDLDFDPETALDGMVVSPRIYLKAWHMVHYPHHPNFEPIRRHGAPGEPDEVCLIYKRVGLQDTSQRVELLVMQAPRGTTDIECK